MGIGIGMYEWFQARLNNKVTSSKCQKCPHRLFLLLTGDCLQIQTPIDVVEVKCETDWDYEHNQICHASCPQGSGVITTRKFFKLAPEYWRKRYLLEHMGWPHKLLYGRD